MSRAYDSNALEDYIKVSKIITPLYLGEQLEEFAQSHALINGRILAQPAWVLSVHTFVNWTRNLFVLITDEKENTRLARRAFEPEKMNWPQQGSSRRRE